MKMLVVVGNGMAGVACVEQVLRHAAAFDITIVGDETHVDYNRVLLSSVLAGERSPDEIVLNPLDWYRQHNISLRVGTRVTDVDGARRTISDDGGAITAFDVLVLATGSSAWMPSIPGLDKNGVFVFRTLDDTRALLGRAGAGVKAVVIGGGMLGLEAVRGLQVQGCEVTVVHLMDTLMERQRGPAGGTYLRDKIEALGVQVLLGRRTQALLGGRDVTGVEFSDGSRIDADLVVVAAGIRPNRDLGRKAGLPVNRGSVGQDYQETAHPDVLAGGEGGKVKIRGVDVFSAGAWEDGPGASPVRFEDPALGVYKKVVLRDGRLSGVILVGDTSDSHRYMDWLRTGADLATHRRQLLFPPPAADTGLDIAQMADTATVCGCVGVTKGAIIGAIHQQGVNTLSQLKEATRASTGCGSCTALCQELLKAVAPEFEEETRKVLCRCVPFAQESLREVLRSQRLRSVQEGADTYGEGRGCEICKPALSYMLDMLWCGDHDEDRSARFINDRVHANIQKDDSFSVIPRIRGGGTAPDELRRIADGSDKDRVRLVKITGGQRIELLGIRKHDRPHRSADLGMPSGQAYTKGVRTVNT